MKFVKRISLFFIYPCLMFSLGFAAHMAIQSFFYPGKAPLAKAEASMEENRKAQEEAREVILAQDPVITADTGYVVMRYDAVTGETSEELQTAPDKYIGLTRERLEKELKAYCESPSLTDLEQGFSHIELLSFSPAKVVVRKSFEKEEEGFFLVNEDHHVVVYDKSLAHVYMNTGILTKNLPAALQDEIMKMKYIENENQLYHFLESYSS